MVRRPDDSGVIAEVVTFSKANDYDILLQNNKGWFWTHKSILARWSPFFERAFNSKFSVASSPIFELDDEEDMVAFEEMLKYMHGSHDYQTLPIPDYSTVSITDEELVTRLKYCLHVYTIADKYDCPALRAEVYAETFHLLLEQICRLERYAMFIPFIRSICGPDAPFFADGRLYDKVAELCKTRAWRLQQHEDYVEMLHSGLSLDIQRQVVFEDLAWQWDDDIDSDGDGYGDEDYYLCEAGSRLWAYDYD